MYRLLSVVALSLSPAIALAQSAPVADAFKRNAENVAKNLIAAAEEMPADKYSFRPTPAQMSFAQVVLHLAQGNDYLCGAIGGTKAPERSKIDTTATKEALLSRLRETFAFCDQALALLNDSKLAEQLPMFGGRTMTRAAVMTLTTGDWADHYSQSAIYLRLNGLLPPTAKRS
jgi:uncharacterized damage-inducible protein DinB